MLVLILALASAGYLYYNPDVAEKLVPDHITEMSRQHERAALPPLNHQTTAAVNPNWQPNQWDPNAYHTEDVLARFVQAGVIYNAYFDEISYTPVLKVGPNFYNLSDQDKSNTIAYFNEAYGLASRYGHFDIKDWQTEQIIGRYNNSGLYLF